MEDRNTIDIVVGKLDGLKELFNEKFDRNDGDHKEIKDKQDHTNGDIVDLKKWKEQAVGALSVIKILLIPIIIGVMVSLVVSFVKPTQAEVNQKTLRQQVIEILNEEIKN